MNHAAHDANSTNGSHAHPPVEQVARHADAQAQPVCPYCGGGVPTAAGRIGDVGTRCPACKGLLDELSIHATRGHMGEWFIRDEAAPFRPGCSLATLRTMIERGRVTPMSVVRGPDTEQFWMRAARVPRTARLMGICHECGMHTGADSIDCESCGTRLMSVHDALSDPSWHGTHAAGHDANPLAAAVAAPGRTIAAELADSTVKRQMQREVQMWARRAGLSIGIAAILFLVVIALVTKDVWWSRVRGDGNGPLQTHTQTHLQPQAQTHLQPQSEAPASVPAVNQTGVDPAAAESQGTEGGANTQGAQPPHEVREERAPPAPTRAGRDPLWDEIRPLIAADSNESLMRAMELLQRVIDTVGVTRADEHAQAIAVRDWIERRLQTRELDALP